MKFNKMLRDRIRAAEERYAAEVKKNAEIFEEEQEVEAWKMIDKKGQFRFNLDRQMDYILMKKEFARLEVENEKQDLANMKKKIEKLAAKEKEEKARLREMLRNDIERFNQTEKAIRDQRLKEEEQEKVLNEIFVDTQMKIDDERNTKERNLIKYTRGKLCEKTLAELMPKPKTDDEKFAEEVLKKEENEIKRIEERKTKKERMLKELLEFEKEAVEKAKRDQIFEKEKKKWEVVQKFKRQELDDKWNREERERERARKMEVKDGYIAQWHENAEKRRKEKIDDLRFLHDPKEEVEEVLKYCDKVLDYTKKHGRPSFPVLTTISVGRFFFLKDCGLSLIVDVNPSLVVKMVLNNLKQWQQRKSLHIGCRPNRNLFKNFNIKFYPVRLLNIPHFYVNLKCLAIGCIHHSNVICRKTILFSAPLARHFA